MSLIIEIARPYSNTALQPLPGETVLNVNGHAFWCASSRVARVIRFLLQEDFPNRLDDAVWICEILNAYEIQTAMRMPHRHNRMQQHTYENMVQRLQNQLQDIANNPEIATMMDDQNELTNKLAVWQERLKKLRES